MMFELLPASDEDFSVCWRIGRDAFVGALGALGWTPAATQKFVGAWRAASTLRVVVAGRTVGWVRREREESRDWLDLIAIAPAAQRRGLGEEVLRRLLADARGRNVPLWLSVHRSNPARKLYRRLGAIEVDRDEVRVFAVFRAESPIPFAGG